MSLPFVASHTIEAGAVSFFSSGKGKSSCQQYLVASTDLEPNKFRTLFKERRTFVSENNVFDQWIFGFVSALNYASGDHGGAHPDVKFHNEELLSWIRGWCNDHPDETVLKGALAFMKDRWSSTGAASASGGSDTANLQFVFVIFQAGASDEDKDAFLKTYNVSVADGPNPDGFFKLQLANPLSADRLESMLESMRGQGNVVKTAVVN